MASKNATRSSGNVIRCRLRNESVVVQNESGNATRGWLQKEGVVVRYENVDKEQKKVVGDCYKNRQGHRQAAMINVSNSYTERDHDKKMQWREVAASGNRDGELYNKSDKKQKKRQLKKECMASNRPLFLHITSLLRISNPLVTHLCRLLSAYVKELEMIPTH